MTLLDRRPAGSAGADTAGPLTSPTGQAPQTVLKSLKIDGQISAHDDMYVDAEINGPITSDASVTIGPSGVVLGEVKGRIVVVFGRVTGDIEATQRVELHATAKVTGDIHTFHISLDEKAAFKGRIDCKPLDAVARPMPSTSETSILLRESQSA